MTTFTCPHCNQTHPTGARFCSVTGQPIPAERACSNCGKSVQESWRVCPACGTSLLPKEEKVSKPAKKPIRIVGLILLVVVLLSGTAYGASRLWPQPNAGGSSREAGLPYPQLAPSSEEIEYSQDESTNPGLTEMPKLELPVLADYPLPQSNQPITSENVTQVTQLARLEKGVVNEVAYTPDGKILAVASSIGGYLYDSSNFEQVRLIERADVVSIAISPDGQTLASHSGTTVRLWRISDGSLLESLEGHWRRLGCVAFSPDGQTLASCADSNTIRLWRVSDGSLLRTLEGHAGWVNSVAFSPDGQTIASGSTDRTVRLWLISDGSLLRILKGYSDGIRSVAFSPDGWLLASGSDDGTIDLWVPSDGRLLDIRFLHSEGVNRVSFSSDGQTLSSGSNDGIIWLWRVSDGRLLRTLEGHTDVVSSLIFSSDNHFITSSSHDGTIRFWRIAP
jgi:dipeptidyl aminopeptidase/acylaminoacyl peptidase/predicted nucleic acid-binding Zn ribbon protein